MLGWRTIPGETPIDISGLRIKTVTTRAMLNRAEAQNILAAARKYLSPLRVPRTATFQMGWSKKLHKEMFGKVWTWAGEVRNTHLNIGVPAHHVESLLQSLFEDLAFWKKSAVPLIEQAVMLHHRAVYIHPFNNGNGRWARLLANIWLKQNDHAITKWPEQTLGAESVIRGDYLVAIKAADGMEYGPLIRLVSKYTVD